MMHLAPVDPLGVIDSAIHLWPIISAGAASLLVYLYYFRR